MTLFVLLPAAARTGIVAADFWFFPLHLTDDVVAARASRTRRVGGCAGAAPDRPEGGAWRLRPAHRDLGRPAGGEGRPSRGCGPRLVIPRDRRQSPEVPDDLLFD